MLRPGTSAPKDEGLTNCKFQEGDASNLHELKDHTFDLVVSIFGAMFAPKPFDVAKEMVRVTRPGGRIVMGNWIPNDPTLVAQILKISSSYSPPPPEGFISPMTWGIESNVIERFAAAGVPKEKISFVRDTYTFNFPSAASELVDAFRKYYGPTMNAFEAAEKNGRAGDLQKELEVLFNIKTKAQARMPPPFQRPFYALLLCLIKPAQHATRDVTDVNAQNEMSTYPLRADIPPVCIQCPLCATNGHKFDRDDLHFADTIQGQRPLFMI